MGDPRRRNISQRSEMIYDCHEFGVIPDTREIFLNSRTDVTLYEEGAMIDHWAATHFIRNLRLLLSISQEPILVHMVTCGGDWNYGMAIYDAIKESCESEVGAEITVLAYGHSRSMSSVIPQAATQRVIMPNADFLIHWGSMGVEGNLTSVLSEAEQAKKACETMLEIYLSRCKDGPYWKQKRMSQDAIRDYLRDIMDRKQEVYMTPREAVDKGFMDAVLGDDNYETIGMLKNGQKNSK